MCGVVVWVGQRRRGLRYPVHPGEWLWNIHAIAVITFCVLFLPIFIVQLLELNGVIEGSRVSYTVQLGIFIPICLLHAILATVVAFFIREGRWRFYTLAFAVGQMARVLATAFLMLVSLALPVGDVVAVDNLDTRLASLSGDGWQAVGISSSLHLGEGGRAELGLQIRQISLTDPQVRLGPLLLRCPLTGLDSESLRCVGGQLSIVGAGLDQPELGVDLGWNAATGNLVIPVVTKEHAQLSDCILALFFLGGCRIIKQNSRPGR